GTNLVDEVLHYARKHNVTKILVGKPREPRWKEILWGSFVYELTRKCGDIDVYVISGEGEPESGAVDRGAPRAVDYWPYLWALLVVVLCTGVGFLMFPHFAPVNLVMVYLLGVVAVAVRYGQGPSILASILGVAAFDFFFIPPRYTFAVADTQYLFTFVVMLA